MVPSLPEQTVPSACRLVVSPISTRLQIAVRCSGVVLCRVATVVEICTTRCRVGSATGHVFGLVAVPVSAEKLLIPTPLIR